MVIQVKMNEVDKMQSGIKFEVDYMDSSGTIDVIVDGIYEQLIRYSFVIPAHGCRADVHKKHLKVVLINLIKAQVHGCGGYVSYNRNNNYFEYRKTRYNPNNIRPAQLRTVVDALIELGYIINKRGYKDWSKQSKHRSSEASKMRLANHGLEMIKNIGVSYCNDGIYRGMEVIQLKGIKDHKTKMAPLLQYKDTHHTKRMRKNLRSYNEFISTQLVFCPNLRCKRHVVYRVFNNGSWHQGGRFYSGCYENMIVLNSEVERVSNVPYRNDIKINENSVIELDYKAFHPSILYHDAGFDLDFDFDPYIIDGLQREKVVKPIFNILINSASEKLAFCAIRYQVNRLKKIIIPVGWTIEKVVAAIREKNYKIDKYFFSSVANSLMNRDSFLTESIINYFTKKNLVVLPVHDSYIVESKHATLLHEVMITEFNKRFGFTPKIDKKY